MSSFNGQTFVQIIDTEDQQQEAVVSVRHIIRSSPGGSDAYVDIGGVKPREITLPVQFATEQEYTNFRAQLGLAGPLVFDSGTLSAVLMSVAAGRIIPSSTYRQATARFLITG